MVRDAIDPRRKNVGTPPAYNWTSAKLWAKDPVLSPLFDIFALYKLPAATVGYQLNPSPTSIPLVTPTTWRNPQSWWMAGFGMSYKAPMRVASVSKPITNIVYANNNLLNVLYNKPFYALWTTYVGALPNPIDARVKIITVSQLLKHTSGFDNAVIGYDPAFQGKSVSVLLPTILSTKKLATDPGAKYSYSNFGYMILARLAEGVTGQPWLTLVRKQFPSNAPIYAAQQSVAVSAAAIPNPGAAEPR